MRHRYLEIASTPSVRAARARWGGVDRDPGPAAGPVANARLGPDEAAFIAERDGFFLASVSETGWPYVQHRGGPAGFLRVLDEETLGFADFRGNRQYLTVGNVSADDRVSLLLMDWANRRRLKVLGRLAVDADPAFAARLAVPGYPARVERAMRIRVEAFDWDCPQHIQTRFTEAEVAAAVAPLHARIATLEAEVARLRGAPLGARPGEG